MKYEKNKQQLKDLRHSAAHLLAAAIEVLYPKAHRTIGPATENGFYYDFDFGDQKVSEEDFSKIEQKMRELVKSWQGFERLEVAEQEAKEKVKGNPYKEELITEITAKGESITFYRSGGFEDLCHGGHIEKPKETLKHFKLLSVAGAYWRGDEKNKMLTRIYGTAFPTKEEVDNYLLMLEEAKKRDHRKIGKELGLFVIADLVGSGLPLFTPKGTILRDQLTGFSEQLQLEKGFQKVWIPHITKIDLYKRSGHWDKFGDELFLVESRETHDEFALKPMNCPHHAQIYASQIRSYKDLPIRYMETTTVYRDEKTGELGGISRVRSITQDDAHVFCTMGQIDQEFENIMSMIKQLYSTLGMEFKARLSFRDSSEKYLGDQQNWDQAQKIIEDLAKKLDINYVIVEGEAAFYGPKIDVMVIDALGREHQCATEQLDFVQPERFGLRYIDVDGTEKTPVMIHKALLGSVERFLSVYIEHTAGNFPTWLSPIQVQIIPIADRHVEYGQKLLEQLKYSMLRTEIDTRSETMQSKIRDAQNQKIPYMIIVGDKEQQAQKISVRTRKGFNVNDLAFDQFLEKVKQEVAEKSTDLTLVK